MANQPEVTSYDSGVYQIEATDPVDGGVGAVTNSPLLSLANRTNYLKKHLDDIESGTFVPNGLAPLNSPGLTGSPTAPTQASGDSSTKLANTAFVQGTVNGLTFVDISGGVTTTLTTVQAGFAIIALSGALTANKAIVFPSVPGKWQVLNLTTGAFTLTLKTAAGTGVFVNQGASTNIYCSGSSIGFQQTDFISPALTGNPTSPTLSRFATGTGIVNADALRAAGIQFSGLRSIALSVATVGLTAADAGSVISVTGSGGGNLVLPPANSVPAGAIISVRGDNTSVSTNTVSCSGTDTLSGALGTGVASTVIRVNDYLILVSNGVNGWLAISESTFAQRAGRLLNVRVFTANATYVETPGTNSIIVECIGAGGGGGGANPAGAGQISSGGNGGGGAYAKGRFTSGFSGLAITIGVGGNGGGTGQPGGATSLGSLISASGGSGGGAGVAFNPPGSSGGATQGGISITGGNIVTAVGYIAQAVVAISTSTIINVQGAPSQYGPGPSGGFGNGQPAVSKGTGGTGALCGPSTGPFNGGAGAPGVLIISEYT